jgi:hypothetical protein
MKGNDTIAIILLLYMTLVTLSGIYVCIRRRRLRLRVSPGSEKRYSPPPSPSSTGGSNSYHSPPPEINTRMLTDAPRGEREGGIARGGGGRGGQIGTRGGGFLLRPPQTDGGFNVAGSARVVGVVQDGGFNVEHDGGFNAVSGAGNR